MRVTPSLFRVLRVPPALGRAFTDAEGEIGERAEGHPEPRALAAAVRRGSRRRSDSRCDSGGPDSATRSSGVMPRGVFVLRSGLRRPCRRMRDGVQFWIPLAFTPEQKSDSGAHALRLLPHRAAAAGRHRSSRCRRSSTRFTPRTSSGFRSFDTTSSACTPPSRRCRRR